MSTYVHFTNDNRIHAIMLKKEAISIIVGNRRQPIITAHCSLCDKDIPLSEIQKWK